MSETEQFDDTGPKPAQRSFRYREKIYGTIIACYFVPVLTYNCRALGLLPSKEGWNLLSTGLLLTIFGSLILILMVRRWELSLRARLLSSSQKKQPYHHRDTTEKETSNEASHLLNADSHITPFVTFSSDDSNIEVLQTSLSEAQQAKNHMTEQLKETQLTKESLHQELEQLRQEYEIRYQNHQEQFGETENCIQEYRQTIAEQKSLLEQRNHYIAQLENKNRDLNYEVKTLLQLGDIESTPHGRKKPIAHPVIDLFKDSNIHNNDIDNAYTTLPISPDKQIHTPYDAAVQLHKCLEIANKLTGAAHLQGRTPRFREFSITDHSIDLRRLFDSFRNENSSLIVLYSLQEDRMLYANNQIKGLLEWSPEKFIKDFFSLIQEGTADWQSAIKQLETENENQVRIVLKTKNGTDLLLHCHLGKILSGVFQGFVLGVMYPT